MIRVESGSALRQQLLQARRRQQRIAFVPTMGNLHAGHLALIAQAQRLADFVVVSIFVNPLQFDRAEDLARYPRTLEQDIELLTQQGVDLLFTPDIKTLYPNGVERQTFVEVPELSSLLEGASRPGHFRGVTTVLTKLFNLVQPEVACFGEKDFQQLAIVRRMVQDLNLPIEIVGVPTVRAEDGLALSSRNNHLTPAQRQLAVQLSQVMRQMAESLSQDHRAPDQIIQQAEQQLIATGWRPDGLAIFDADNLRPISDQSQRAVILMAAWLGETRLIDNQQVTLSA